MRSDRVAAYLAGKVDLETRVYRHHFRILRDAEGVVCPGDILEDNVGIIVHELIKAAAAESQ